MQPIRDGCWVKWVTIEGETLSGTVTENWYTAEGYHQYTLKLDTGKYYYTNGALLYQRQLEHIPGKISRKEFKKSKKKYGKKLRKEKKQARQYYEKNKNNARVKHKHKKRRIKGKL